MSAGITLNLLLIAGSIILLLIVMQAVRLIGRRFALEAETQRKLVHVATGIYALCLPLIFATIWPVMVLVALSLLVMIALRQPFMAENGLGGALHGVQRRSHGEIYLVLAVGFLFFRSQGQPVLYVLPLLTVTLCDAAAALVGSKYGRLVYRVEEGEKTLEGTLAFFLVTWLLAMSTLLLMTDIDRFNVILVSFAVAAFGALVEADSWGGLDNLFVPLALHLFLAHHMQAAPLTLLILIALFSAAIAASIALAPLVKLPRHAARGYVILVFLILSVTSFHNALLPVAAILAHIAARLSKPSLSRHPDLDLLAMAAGVALFWLFIGEFFGQSAINLYNMTYAIAAAAFIALALRGKRPRLAVLAGVVLAIGLALLNGFNAVEAHWHGTLWPWTFAAMAVVIVLAFTRPELFARQRSARIFALSMIAPLLVFLLKGNLS